MEPRVVLATGSGLATIVAAHAHHAKPKPQNTFVAHLRPIAALAGDRASAVINVQFIDDASQAAVSGVLRDISNPSAVVLRLPAVTSMSSVTTTVTTTPPGTTTTVKTSSTSMNAQTVAVLLKPGPASGPYLHVHFEGTISSASLIGALTGKRLRQLRQDMLQEPVSAVVTTNNGVDSAMTVAPGNAQSGEIMGQLMKVK